MHSEDKPVTPARGRRARQPVQHVRSDLAQKHTNDSMRKRYRTSTMDLANVVHQCGDEQIVIVFTEFDEALVDATEVRLIEHRQFVHKRGLFVCENTGNKESVAIT